MVNRATVMAWYKILDAIKKGSRKVFMVNISPKAILFSASLAGIRSLF